MARHATTTSAPTRGATRARRDVAQAIAPRDRSARGESRESVEPTTTRLYGTKNDLPEEIRIQVGDLLNARLADCIDLETQCKQAHWNVKGPTFIALHELFDDVSEAVEEYVDLIAERIVQLGGIAEGTARIVAERTTLLDYPLTLRTGEEHVAALSDVLAQFGREVRMGIGEMDALGDADTADILTEVSRGVDKWLWFVEAHLQAGFSETIDEDRREPVRGNGAETRRGAASRGTSHRRG